MIEISKPLTHFQSCNCCGRYNKCGPGTEQMYKSLCKNIREYVINGMCIRLCEDCARQLRDQLNEILDEKQDTFYRRLKTRRKHNGKIYFPHYEETWLADTLAAMVKSMQETGHLYYVEWNGEFYYSDEVKIDGNSVICEGKND